jgi:hypothetical protein
MIVKCLSILAAVFAVSTSHATVTPSDGRVDIWPTIPFTRGADLCRYTDAYGQTRMQNLNQMMKLASGRDSAGAGALIAFNELYEKNMTLATQTSFEVTLEATLKSYTDSYFRNLQPKVKKLSFTGTNDILSVIRTAQAGTIPELDRETLNRIDYVAYGTYALAPNCQGDVQVTLQLVGLDGQTESFVATGRVDTVMSQIASEIFVRFQRTQFPSAVKVGANWLTLVGGFNNSVDHAPTSKIAEEACSTLDARLPTSSELEILNVYGDWSGGVSLNNKVWALSNGYVYVPYMRNPSPVRRQTEMTLSDDVLYYCVK